MASLDFDYEICPQNGEKPHSVVMLLHGYGANGNDLFGLAREWAPALPKTAWVSPNAPFPLENYSGQEAFQWFGLEGVSPAKRYLRVQETAPILNDFMDEVLNRYGLKDDRLILAGFSQGTVMALYTALRRPVACAGILGYSGRFAHSPGDDWKIRSHPKTLLLHGEMDEVIPVTELYQSKEEMTRLEIPGRYVVEPMLGHAISAQGLALGQSFIQFCLEPKQANESLEAWAPQMTVST